MVSSPSTKIASKQAHAARIAVVLLALVALQETHAQPAIYGAGANDRGQIVLPDTSDNIYVNATTVSSLSSSSVVSMAAGALQSFAISADGTLRAFGANSRGQLGVGDLNDRKVPTPVTFSAGSGIKIVAATSSDDHSLALDTAGHVHSCGYNIDGQLGRVQAGNGLIFEPINLAANIRIVAVSAAANGLGTAHSLVLDVQGRVWGFGSNAQQQLGLTNVNSTVVPMLIQGVLAGVNITAISAGALHSLVLSASGDVYSFGKMSTRGRTDSAMIGKLVLPAGVRITTISASPSGSASHLSSAAGKVYAFGLGSQGELGLGSSIVNAPTPVEVTALSAVSAVSVQTGLAHTLVKAADGSVYSFGCNFWGQAALGSIDSPIYAPQRIVFPLSSRRVDAIVPGGMHSLFSEAASASVASTTIKFSSLQMVVAKDHGKTMLTLRIRLTAAPAAGSAATVVITNLPGDIQHASSATTVNGASVTPASSSTRSMTLKVQPAYGSSMDVQMQISSDASPNAATTVTLKMQGQADVSLKAVRVNKRSIRADGSDDDSQDAASAEAVDERIKLRAAVGQSYVTGEMVEDNQQAGLSTGAIAGAVIGAVVGAALIGAAIGVVVMRRRRVEKVDVVAGVQEV